MQFWVSMETAYVRTDWRPQNEDEGELATEYDAAILGIMTIMPA